MIFDKDNTLTNPYEYEISDNMRSSLERCISEFGERGVAIFSNTAGNKDDAKNDYKDSKHVESNLGISVIHHVKQVRSSNISCHFQILMKSHTRNPMV